MPEAAGGDGRGALLFLPGLLCDARIWAQQAEALSDSAKPLIADLTLDHSIGAMAERALAAAPPRFALAGLSMGGYVAFEIMRRAPDRVTRLALFDTSAAPDSAEQAERRRAGIASLALGRFLGVTDRLLPELVAAAHVDGPVGATVRAMAAAVGADAYVRQQRAILARPDSRPLLERIAVPTLVAVGQEDRLTPPDQARAIAAAIPGARLSVIAGCGHLPPIEAPEATTALLREWLG